MTLSGNYYIRMEEDFGCSHHLLLIPDCTTAKLDCDRDGEDALDNTFVDAAEDFVWHSKFPQPS